MVKSDPARSAQYNHLSKLAEALIQKHASLKTFGDVQAWKADSQATRLLLRRLADSLDQYCQVQTSDLHEVEGHQTSLPFIQRVTAIRKTEKTIQGNITAAESMITRVKNISHSLAYLSDDDPSSKAEQNEVLANLHRQKQALSLEKYQVDQGVRKIQAKARSSHEAASRPGRPRKSYVDHQATIQSIDVASDKKGDLERQKAAQADLARQIAALEKRIAWVAHFKEKA